MALQSQDYTNLFAVLGSIVQLVNKYMDLSGETQSGAGSGEGNPNLAKQFTDAANGHHKIIAEDKDRFDVIEGMYDWFNRAKDQASENAQSFSEFASTALTGQAITQPMDGLPANPTLEDVLRELVREMKASTTTVYRSQVTVNAPAADAGNVGTGTMLALGYLDQVTPPHPGYPAYAAYDNLKSELAAEAETMSLQCIRDTATNGTAEGEEIFELRGWPAQSNPWSWRVEGSGTQVTVPTLNSYQLILNKDFDGWNGDVPTGWVLDNGTAGTHVLEEATLAQVFRGEGRALKLHGDGVQATIGISLPIGSGLVTPGKMYLLACQVKGDATVVAGTLQIAFNGTGYMAASTLTGGVAEQISMNAAALAAQTAYGLEYFWIIMPDVIPDDFELIIEITGTLTAGADVRICNLAFGPAIYANGVAHAVVAGDTPFRNGDRFTMDVTNDNDGIFQTFFRRKYGVQLPTSATPTIADAVANPLTFPYP